MTGSEAQSLDADLARLADGDRSAFDPVFRASWPLLCRFTSRYVGAGADAEDAAQRALLRVFARASTFRRGERALPWMMAIAANECLGIRRGRRSTEEISALADLPAPDALQDERIERRQLLAAAEACIGALDAAERETLRAHLVGQPPELPPATFRKRVSRALGRLRLVWEERHE